MSVDLGVRYWKLVGVVDGFALFTHWSEARSRWVDLTRWPGKLQPAREEWTRAVCRGAVLVGWAQQTVQLQRALGKPRKQLALPTKKHGYRAIGMVGDRVVVVPGHLGMDNHASPLTVAAAPLSYDGAWRALEAEGGSDTPRAAVVNLDDGRALVVYGGRALLLDKELAATDAGDLPRVHPNFDPGYVPTGDGFVTVGDGKLVTVSRAGKHRTDKRIGKLSLVHVSRYEDRLLLYDGRHHYLYDDKAERLDLGTTHDDPETLIAAPCGLVALVDDDHLLVRVRSSG